MLSNSFGQKQFNETLVKLQQAMVSVQDMENTFELKAPDKWKDDTVNLLRRAKATKYEGMLPHHMSAGLKPSKLKIKVDEIEKAAGKINSSASRFSVHALL